MSKFVAALEEARRMNRVVGSIGDVNWLWYGGGPVYQTEHGFTLEYVQPPEEDDENVVIYRVDLDQHVPTWGDINAVASSIGGQAGVLKQAFESEDPLRRANAYLDWAGHYGWHEFDSYPLTLNKEDVNRRYFATNQALAKLAKKPQEGELERIARLKRKRKAPQSEAGERVTLRRQDGVPATALSGAANEARETAKPLGGYAFVAHGIYSRRSPEQWMGDVRAIKDENWDTEVITPAGDEQYVGRTTIDGWICRVWWSPSENAYIAQAAYGRGAVTRSDGGFGAEARRPRTGPPVRYKDDLFEVLAWNGDYRTKDMLHGYHAGKDAVVVRTHQEARDWANAWMNRSPPLNDSANVRISETTRSGDTYYHEKWLGKYSAEYRAELWTFMGVGKLAGTAAAPASPPTRTGMLPGVSEQPSNVSWTVPLDATGGKWVEAPLMGQWLRAYLQATTPSGYWVQFDADGPFRLVSDIRELRVRRSGERGPARRMKRRAFASEASAGPNNGKRRIRITFSSVDADSAAQGDTCDSGWIDEEGVDMEPDADETAVEKSVKFLKDEGATEPSSSEFHPGIWYSWPDMQEDYRTGVSTEQSYHLKGFSQQEEARIYEGVTGRTVGPELERVARLKQEGAGEAFRYEAGERRGSRGKVEARDTTCQPFTRVVRDPEKLSACQARAKGPIENSRAAYDLVRADLERNDQETFVVICLDFRGQVRDYAQVAMGQRHRVAVDVEDILAVVLLSRADGFLIAHNHPSGVAEPSDADCDLTEAVRNAAVVACPNVKLLDHLVCGASCFYSFADHPPKRGKDGAWEIGKVTKVS